MNIQNFMIKNLVMGIGNQKLQNRFFTNNKKKDSVVGINLTYCNCPSDC